MKNETEALNDSIDWLNDKQTNNLRLLTEKIYQTYESLKPIHLINKTLEDINKSPEIRQTALKGMLSIAIDFLAKRIIFGASQKLLLRNMPLLLQMALAIVALKNSDKILAKVEDILQYIFQYPSEKR